MTGTDNNRRMLGVKLPDASVRPLEFYLAMEEYLAGCISEGRQVGVAGSQLRPGDEIFFLWQVAPTVIFGRNQIAEAEVNLEYCREHGIRVVRRKSGGGCVYSDGGNIMLSYITSDTGVETVFPRFLSMVRDALQDIGLEAVTTANNDILVGGAKVSGNAFFALAHASIVHGTMLYDSDFSVLEKAITPSVEKLSKHGVKSVRQRVGNLCSLGLNLSIEDFKRHFTESFCAGELVLSDADMEEINAVSMSYQVVLGR